MRVLVHHRASPGFLDVLRASAGEGLVLDVVAEDDRAALERALPDAEALLHVLEPLDRETLARAPRLRLVQKIGVGVNTIDVEACRALGIGVANMPGTNTQAVVELTLALMLASLRRIVELDRETRAGRGFPLDPALLDEAGELAGRVVGLVGWGAVPQRLAPILDAIGARVVVHARRPEAVVGRPTLGLDALLAEADLVSLHLPLDAQTRALLSEARLRAMKPGAILVSTARGGLVDQPALVRALREGPLRAAGLDVFADEPIDPRDPLFALPNVVTSPHVAWRTPETLRRSFAIAFENCRRAGRQALLHEIVPVGRVRP